MTTIYLTVTGAHVTARPDGPLTSGMVGLPVVISYDSTWEDLTKTLVCRSSMGKSALDLVYVQANIGTQTTVAPEVMLAHRHLYLGIEGRTANGTLVVPTIWADCGMIQPGAESSGTESQEVTPEVWAQLASQIGPLEQLNTSRKESLVTAVNALAQASDASQEALSKQITQAQNQNSASLTAAKAEIGAAIQEVQDQLLAFSQGTQVSQEALAQQINQIKNQNNQNASDLTAAKTEMGSAIQQVQDRLSADIRALEEEMARIPEPEVVPEPGEGDIPQVYLDGTMPTDQTETQALMTYISKTDFFTAHLTLRCADDNSADQEKKSFAVQMFSNSARTAKLNKSFRDWGYASNTYLLRSNFIDHSHARNIVASRLWNDVMVSREDYSDLPASLRESPRNGATDGFPVKVYWNGTYQGLYTWNMGSERWNMSEGEQGVLRALTNSDANQIDTPCNFRALWSGISGDHWTLETSTGADLSASLNDLITFVQEADDAQFRSSIGHYLDTQSAMDYFLFQLAICGVDALGKNLHLATYDGTKWFCGCGDMDATFLLSHDGNSFVPETCCYPQDFQEIKGILWERLRKIFTQELKDRYHQLRTGALSFSNMCNHFELFMEPIPGETYQEDAAIFPSIPQADTNNIRQIRNAIRDRLSYCDDLVAILEVDPLDYTRNPLADVTWYDDYYYVNGEMTAKTSEHCTSRFSLQNCLYRLTYTGGLYHTLYMWDKDGNFMGEVQNQLSYFTGRSDFQYAFRVNVTSNFSPSSITIMPVDNEATAAEPITLKLSELNFSVSSSAIQAPVRDLFALDSLTTAAIAARIHHSDAMVIIASSYTKPTGIDPEKLCVVSFYISNQVPYLGTRLYGNVVDDAMAFFTAHDTTIHINS